MTPIVAATPQSLIAALKAASAGAVILLAPGKWDPVLIFRFQSPGEVTVRSQDPAHPAILSALTINESEGLKFTDLTLATELYNAPTSYQAPAPFRIIRSKRISLEGLSVHGTLDDNPQDDVNGVWVTDSVEITIRNCEFQQLFNALTELRNDRVVIADNNFHDIRNDGIDNGGTSDIKVTGNHFTDFYPVGAVGSTGDHADAIQFWTTNTKTPAHDIEITHNSFVRGHGSWIQGVFVTDQVGIPFQRVTITDNTIEGGEYNGVMVQGCNGLTIHGNTVRPYADMMSWIRVEQCTNAIVKGNRAGSYVYKRNGDLDGDRNDQLSAMSPPFRMRKP